MNMNRTFLVVVLAAAVCFLGGAAWAGYDEIHMAAMWGDSAKAEQLLAQGADVDARDTEGATPLFYAAGHGHNAVAELLLAKGADVNATSSDGNTSLHNAARGGAGFGKSDGGDYKAVVELLLAHGADVNARDRIGRTPLRMAIEGGNQEIIELLRQHGGTE